MTKKQAVWNGVVLAEVRRHRDGGERNALPRHLRREHFSRATPTVCGWKGTASYHHVTANGRVNRDAAWHYPEPREAAKQIRGRVAFWKGVVVRDA